MFQLHLTSRRSLSLCEIPIHLHLVVGGRKKEESTGRPAAAPVAVSLNRRREGGQEGREEGGDVRKWKEEEWTL